MNPTPILKKKNDRKAHVYPQKKKKKKNSPKIHKIKANTILNGKSFLKSI